MDPENECGAGSQGYGRKTGCLIPGPFSGTDGMEYGERSWGAFWGGVSRISRFISGDKVYHRTRKFSQKGENVHDTRRFPKAPKQISLAFFFPE